MKSLKKRTPAKKQKQQLKQAKMSQDDNTIVLDLGESYNYDYGAAQPSYALSSSGIDTITLDNMATSVTIPSSWTTTASGTSYTITNGAGGGGMYGTGAGLGVNWNSSTSTVHIDGSGLTMKQGADIKIGEKSLTEAIEKIEERLGILKPNPELEERWEKLKELRKQYMELEKDLLEKEKIMKILKET